MDSRLFGRQRLRSKAETLVRDMHHVCYMNINLLVFFCYGKIINDPSCITFVRQNFQWQQNHFSIFNVFRYRTALAHTGLLALTSPYVDSGGAGVVITAGRALYRGEPSHMHHTNDEVLGVMAADFPLTYFHR